MTINGILKKLEELETQKHLLEMKEIWLDEDFDKFDSLCLEEQILNKTLERAKYKFKNMKLEDLGIGDSYGIKKRNVGYNK